MSGERCPVHLMPGMRCASERGHDGLCAPYEPDEPDEPDACCIFGGAPDVPDDEPMTRRDSVDGHEYVVTYGRDRDAHYEDCDHPSHKVLRPRQLPYDEACAHYAEVQGITAIETALKALNIEVVVEQTGGFCMVAYVRPKGGPIIALSNDGPIIVCVYLSEEAEMDGRFDVLHKFETEQEAAAKVAEILKGLT